MGRPPCCDKAGVKKGPWMPEEDIILVSYIQEHGPGNWRSVPTKTGEIRVISFMHFCLLRPGIKRGNFTPHEEEMIIHFQSLLGNRYISLKKKIKKNQTKSDDAAMASSNSGTTSSSYASSTENISRLLEGWRESSPKSALKQQQSDTTTIDAAGVSLAVDHKNCAPSEDLESLLSLDSMLHGFQSAMDDVEAKHGIEAHQYPQSLMDKWIFDEGNWTR